jgi:hypothetical protein
MNMMMDANLKLQIQRAGGKLDTPAEGATAPIFEMASHLRQDGSKILTVCGGNFDPFDFGLTKPQHEELFHSGQLCVHLLASNDARRRCAERSEGPSAAADVPAVLSGDARLKALLYIMHLDYPAVEAAGVESTPRAMQ